MTSSKVLASPPMTALDSTGVEVLEQAVSDARQRGLVTVIGGGHARFRKRLTRSTVLAGLPRLETAEMAVAAIETGTPQ